VVDAALPWITKDYLTVIYSRITHMRAVDQTLGLLPEASLVAFKCLWPGDTAPDNTNLVAERLLETGARAAEGVASLYCSRRSRHGLALHVLVV
jgi:hypothetical protein